MNAVLTQIERKNMSKPDEKRTFARGQVELASLGGVTFGRATLQPGWKWSTCVKPLVKTTSCQASHLQYQISGQLHVEMEDGTTADFGPGDVAHIPSGHDAWVVGNEPVVLIDITGLAEYAKPK